MKVRSLLALALAVTAAACTQHSGQGVSQSSAAGVQRMTTSPAVSAAKARRSNAASAHRFASVPDRGALLAFPSAPVVRHDGAYTWHRADVSEAHARDAIGGVLALTSPSGEPLRFQYSRHAEHAGGNWTWVGKAVGDASREAIITFGEKAAFGSIGQPGKEPLRLTIRDGVSWLVETDPKMIAGINNAATRPQAQDFLVAPDIATAIAHRKAAMATMALGATSGINTSGALTASATTVDLVLGYTPGFVTGLGGESQANTRLFFIVDVANQAYVNSEVDAQVRLVRTVLVNYPDATDNGNALEELTGFKAPSTRTTPNPIFNELRAARNTYGGDLVSLVRKFNDPENAGCGIAWLIGGGQSGIDRTDESFGYSVVSDGTDVGSDGKTYFCRDETLAHEMGHNEGSAHDRDTADGSDNVLQSNEYGAYPYSFGYKTAPGNGNFYTIMAYGDAGQTRYRVFSDPRVTICGGLPCGTVDADNSRTLALDMPIIATFRGTVVPLPAPASARTGDGNADGRADVFWHTVTGQAFQPWFMNGASWAYGPPSSIPSAYRVGVSGDFNGDRRADFLWYDTARTTVWLWLATGDGTYSVVYLRDYPAGWEPVATGDANGDGRADIYWHSPTQQAMQVWLMNGASWTYGVPQGIPSQYRIASVGDYNADGMADILWRDTSDTSLYEWQAQAGGGYSVVYLRDYPRGWQIVATGDLNGDGTADLLWHNPTVQAAQPWLMQGTTWSYGLSNPIPSQYSAATAGDFNGDGRMDVLWIDSTSVWTWSANADGTFGVSYLRSYPAGWSVINQTQVNYGGVSYGGQ